MSLDITKLEKVKERRGKVTARCPACAEGGNDTTGNHLSIDAEGRFACIMFSGNDGKEHRSRIAQIAGKPGEFRPPANDQSRVFISLNDAIASESRRLNRTATTYQYGDAFAVVRFDGEGTGKTFRPFSRNGSGWTMKDPSGPLPLYRLAELNADPSARVYVCEGEKSADAIASIEAAATTSAHGAKSPGKSDWTPLAGREVVILPDNDDEGRTYAQTVADILGKLNPPASVRIVLLPELPPKGDAVEWLDARDAQTPEDCRAELERLAFIAPAEKLEQPPPTIRERLVERRFNLNDPPPPEPVVFSINGTPISHAGNITTIEAAQKSGKSAITVAAIASSFCGEQSDCLGWESLNAKGFAVLHFDTEQSRGDHHRLMTRAVTMAGAVEPPPWLESYCITGFSCAEMREAMLAVIEDAAVKFGGVHSLFLDGVADPVNDVNDPEESFAFVAWLQASAIKGGFPVIGILHLNPNGEKSRGHLGSQLNRKSEHVLRLTKDGETTLVSTQWSRRAPIPVERQPAFAWSIEVARHVSVASASAVKADDKRDSIATLAAECLRGTLDVGMTWEQLHAEIEAKEGCSRATARRRFDDMVKLKVISKRGDKYRLK